MNKAQFVEAVAEKLGGHPSKRAALAEATEAVDAVFDTILRTVVAGERIAVTGFGTFEPVDRAGRYARNPQTGERLRLAATRIPRFRPGQRFRDYVAGTERLPRRGLAVAKAPKGSISGGRSNMPAPAGSPRALAEARAARRAAAQ